MISIKLLGLSLFVVFVISTTPPPPSLFSDVAKQFNTLVQDKFQCSGSETLGRLGATNVNISGYLVACGLLNPGTGICIGNTPVTCDHLDDASGCHSSPVCEFGLVGKNVIAKNGAIRLGGLGYEDSLTTDPTETVSCPPVRRHLVDFNSEFDELRSTSNSLASLDANGDSYLQWGTVLQLVGDGSHSPQVFCVSCSELAAATNVRLTRVSPTTTVIINVFGSSCSIMNKGFENFNSPYTIWNFPQARSLALGGIGLKGTLLAPKADCSEPKNGNIAGHIFVKSWVSKSNGCIEQHWYPFIGENPIYYS